MHPLLKKFQQILNRQPKQVLTGAVVVAALLLWLIYVPSFLAIQRSEREWKRQKAELTEASFLLDQLRAGTVPSLLSERSASEALAKLNSLARAHQIELLEVTPAAVHLGTTQGLVLLPVEMQVEGGYRSLGEFLGDLARSPELGAAFIHRFTVDRQEQLLPRLRGRLSVEIALSQVSDVP